jgi:hypothetical protein
MLGVNRSHSALPCRAGRGPKVSGLGSLTVCPFGYDAPSSTAGAAMKTVIALFALAAIGVAAAVISLAGSTGHLGHHDASLRTIHYDTKYDLSAQRRIPTE